MITQLYTIRSKEEAFAVIEAGGDHLGFAPAQPGLPFGISIEETKEIFKAVGDKAVKVGLTVSDDPDEILKMMTEIKPDIIHVCGDNYYVTPEFCKKAKELIPGVRIMQAIGVKGPESVEEARHYGEFCDILILDTFDPNITGIGAAGATHDWNIDAEIVKATKANVILAGGLSPENVAEAIRIVKPWGVDSLTKTNKVLPDGKRVKDIEKVRAFCKAAKNVKF